jgi:hypothetical protein
MSGHILKALLLSTFFFLFASTVSAQTVNEVFYSSGTKQWVEIYNGTGNAIDLTQYKILDFGAATNGHTVSLCSGNLAPNAYGIVAKVPEDFTGVSYIVCKSALGIKTTADDTVSLKLSSNVIDTVSVPLGSMAGGNSLQRQNGGTWSSAIPTPGRVNASSTPLDNSAASSTEQTATTTQETTPSDSPTSSAAYAYYSASTLSFKDPVPAIELSAGRNRIGSVGSPLEFEASGNFTYTKTSGFKWSFGDGSQGDGVTVSHVYSYPGEYIVMLNASVPGMGNAVSRAVVKVIDPKFEIVSASSQRIEIRNNADAEVSLFGRALWADGHSFVFPQDTIIGARQTISYTPQVTGLFPESLNHVQLLAIGSVEPPQAEARIEAEKEVRIQELENRISSLRQELANLAQAPSPAQRTLNVPREDTPTVPVDASTTSPSEEIGEDILSTESQPASVATSGWFEVVKKFLLGAK